MDIVSHMIMPNNDSKNNTIIDWRIHNFILFSLSCFKYKLNKKKNKSECQEDNIM